jgi:hypothetical protein
MKSSEAWNKHSLYFVLKERKGAWRTSTGRRRIGVKEVKKETFKDQVPSCYLPVPFASCDLQIISLISKDNLTIWL